MSGKKNLERRSDIRREANDQARETDKNVREGERKAINVERLNMVATELTANLPEDEKRKLKQEMERAYQEGVSDFKETEQKMNDHLQDESDSRKEFDEAEMDAKDDSKELDYAEQDVKQAPFAKELKKMSQNLDQVGKEFQASGKDMEKDINKGKENVKNQDNRVKSAKPKLKF